MSKRIKGILIGGGVLLVLAAALILLLLLPKQEEQKPSSEEESVPEGITLVDQEVDQLKRLHVKNPDDEYTIERVGESLWRIPEIQGFPANDSRYGATRASVCSVSAIEVVEENSQRLGDYGLADPQVRFRAEFLDGSVFEMGLGNESPDSTRRYAVVFSENNSTVYGMSTSVLGVASLTRYDYLDTTLLSPYSSEEEGATPEIDRLTITADYMEKPIVLERLTEDDPDIVNDLDTIKMTSPVVSIIKSNWMDSNVYGMFQGIGATRIAAAAPTSEELSAFGLAEPFMTYQLSYEGTSSFKLLVGAGLDKGGNVVENSRDATAYYVMREGTDLVYVVNAASLPWVNVVPKNLISTLVTLPNIMTVDRIKLTLDGQDYTLEITQLPLKEDQKNPDLTFTLNGQEVNEEASRKFYQLLLDASVQDVNTQDPGNDPVMTIVYERKTGRDERVDFYVQEDLTTIVSLNGNKAYVGRYGLIEKVRKELVNLQNGQTVDVNW